jgi:hypothetical protein
LGLDERYYIEKCQVLQALPERDDDSLFRDVPDVRHGQAGAVEERAGGVRQRGHKDAALLHLHPEPHSLQSFPFQLNLREEEEEEKEENGEEEEEEDGAEEEEEEEEGKEEKDEQEEGEEKEEEEEEQGPCVRELKPVQLSSKVLKLHAEEGTIGGPLPWPYLHLDVRRVHAGSGNHHVRGRTAAQDGAGAGDLHPGPSVIIW